MNHHPKREKSDTVLVGWIQIANKEICSLFFRYAH
jgi:hypothetical protein